MNKKSHVINFYCVRILDKFRWIFQNEWHVIITYYDVELIACRMKPCFWSKIQKMIYRNSKFSYRMIPMYDYLTYIQEIFIYTNFLLQLFLTVDKTVVLLEESEVTITKKKIMKASATTFFIKSNLFENRILVFGLFYSLFNVEPFLHFTLWWSDCMISRH